MKEIIKTLLYEWKQRELPEVKERQLSLIPYASGEPKKIIVVSGFRRVGKTYLLFHLAKQLLKNLSREEVMYLNFEDERIPLRTEFLTELIPSIYETMEKEPKYLLLDEIHVIPNWSKWLRRIYDTTKMRIFISGSASKLSEKEIPTELRGRYLELRLFPLSCDEFLRFKGMTFDLRTVTYVKEEQAKMLKALQEYLTYGGLPEIVLSQEQKREIAHSYYQTVVSRDIVERYHILNEVTLKAALLLLLNSKEYSITRLYHNLKSAHYAIGKATLQNYLHYVENSHFMFSVPIFSYKVKDQLQYPRKVYVIDNVFLTTLSTKQAVGESRLYENAVAVALKKKHEVSYWKEQQEVDFVVKEKNTVMALIQVCVDVSDSETKKREVTALLKASKELKCTNLIVVTRDYEGKEHAEWFGKKGTIQFIPLWKYLLENS